MEETPEKKEVKDRIKQTKRVVRENSFYGFNRHTET